jgi:hypothetical protein
MEFLFAWNIEFIYTDFRACELQSLRDEIFVTKKGAFAPQLN